MEFWKLYRLILARKWFILGLVAAAMVIVALVKVQQDYNMTYVATTQVEPSPKAMSTTDIGQNAPAQPVDRFTRLATLIENIKSHYPDKVVNLLRSAPIEQKRAVVRALSDNFDAVDYKSLGIQVDPSAPKFQQDVDQKITAANEQQLNKVLDYHQIAADSSIWQTRSLSETDLRNLYDTLSVGPVYSDAVDQTPGTNPTPTLTNRIEIASHAGVGQPAERANLAVQIANLTAAAFINTFQEDSQREYHNSQQSLKNLVANDDEKLNQARSMLVNFQTRHKIVSLPAAESTYVTSLLKMQDERSTAQVQLSSATKSIAVYDQLIAANPQQTVISLDPRTQTHTQDVKGKLDDAVAALQALSGRYTTQNPDYQHAQQQVKSLQNEYNGLLKQKYVVAHENTQYSALKAQRDAAVQQAAAAQASVSTLNSQIAQLKAQNTALPDAQKQFGELNIAYESALNNHKADEAALSNLKLTSKSLDPGMIRLANGAMYALPDSTSPGLPMLLVYAAILSLILGIGIVIGLDALDNKVETIPDAEKLLGMPVSAVIPAFPPGDPRKMTRLTASDPLSPIAESYRLLRTDLLFTVEDKPFKSLMVATAKPGQGATTTLCNLAVSLAQIGKRVVLIDADLRRPKLHDYFNVSNDTGLTSLLNGECEMEEALKVTDIDNLLVLPSGPLPLNPSEMLASQKMRTLHERLKPHTDFILVDSPSAIAFSDSAILSSFMDAVLLVIRAQEAPRGGEVQVRDMLNKARANVIGVVLNGVKPQLVDSYYYHAAYYPQVSAVPNGALPPPAYNGSGHNGNGHNGNGHNGYERTLEGEEFTSRMPAGSKVATSSGDRRAEPIGGSDLQDDVERTVVMDDIVTVQPAKAKSRFNLRSLFGTDDRE